MKISPKQYALALLGAIKDNPGQEKSVIKDFAFLLKRNGVLSKWPEIEDFFVRLWDEDVNSARVEVVSARELDEASRKVLSEFVAKKLSGKKIDLVMRVDKSLIGGVILRLPDKVLDVSVLSRMKELGRALKA